jgi:hypothetical protein
MENCKRPPQLAITFADRGRGRQIAPDKQLQKLGHPTSGATGHSLPGISPSERLRALLEDRVSLLPAEGYHLALHRCTHFRQDLTLRSFEDSFDPNKR